ncbi:MAG: hypothetical protein Q9159_006276 [Coniocarpon cinnabarinum]
MYATIEHLYILFRASNAPQRQEYELWRSFDDACLTHMQDTVISPSEPGASLSEIHWYQRHFQFRSEDRFGISSLRLEREDWKSYKGLKKIMRRNPQYLRQPLLINTKHRNFNKMSTKKETLLATINYLYALIEASMKAELRESQVFWAFERHCCKAYIPTRVSITPKEDCWYVKTLCDASSEMARLYYFEPPAIGECRCCWKWSEGIASLDVDALEKRMMRLWEFWCDHCGEGAMVRIESGMQKETAQTLNS